MPIKIKDEDGNEHEVFTQEDIDARLAEQNTAFEARLEDLKPKTEEKKSESEEIPAWAKPLQEAVEKLSGTVTSDTRKRHLDMVGSGLTADQRADLEKRFDSLSSVEDPMRRAEDAYLLAMGTRFDAGGVDMRNISAPGGLNKETGPAQPTEADKVVRAALGISEEDVKNFGKDNK